MSSLIGSFHAVEWHIAKHSFELEKAGINAAHSAQVSVAVFSPPCWCWVQNHSVWIHSSGKTKNLCWNCHHFKMCIQLNERAARRRWSRDPENLEYEIRKCSKHLRKVRLDVSKRQQDLPWIFANRAFSWRWGNEGGGTSWTWSIWGHRWHLEVEGALQNHSSLSFGSVFQRLVVWTSVITERGFLLNI